MLLVFPLWAISIAAAGEPYRAEWESLKAHPVPAWFDDAKFGIFIHWGPYSVCGYTPRGRGYAEHFPKNLYRSPQEHYAFLDQRFGKYPPEFGYKDIVPLFKAERWEPADWAELFEQAGARYVILTGEHHDGYAMWDSALTDWCATKIGPRRDVVGDLAEAVRARGMKFAPSYHRERHPGFFAREIYAPASQPQPDVAEEIRRHPAALGLYGPFEYSDAFIADYVARWKELEVRYRPDFLWLDDIPIFYKAPDHPQTRKFRDACRQMIADYLNAARSWDKQVYLNNKGGQPNWPEGVGCREKDNLRRDTVGPKWQNPATLGTSYGYLQAEDDRDAYKTPAQLIHLLADVVSKNGNLLLNIGPRADGTIPAGMRERLLAIGRWLEANGEAIYGTRPWHIHGEEPAGDGPAAKRGNAAAAPGVRFTAADQCVYAIVLGWPSQHAAVTIRSFGRAEAGAETPVRSVTLVETGEALPWSRDASGLKVAFPHKKPPQAELATVVKIELK